MIETEHNILIDCLTKQPVPTGGVLAMGNFDGVHLGHREVIAAAKREGQKRGTKAYVLTFDPHPYSMLRKDGDLFILTPRPIKNRLLLGAGADGVITLPFTPDFALKSPDAFMQDVLIAGCAVQHVVVGFDFVFGHGRGGDRDALRRTLGPLGIGVTEVPPFRDAGGEIISSTRIRAALRHGDLTTAQALLGRPFAIYGKVEHGDHRGREMGFATANINLGEIVRPAYGAYAVQARREGTDEWHAGVANIGKRPTVGGVQEILEFHLFNFAGDLYGQTWEVDLHHYLRAEKAFPDITTLQSQIENDAAKARQLLGAA